MAKVLALITTDDWQAARSDVREGRSPRRDYLELAEALQADVMDLSAARGSPMARQLDRVFRRGAGLAWAASRVQSQYDVIFSDGEHIGLPLGVLLSRKKGRARHVMIGHWLSRWKKRMLAGLAKGGIDGVVVHSSAQADFAIDTLHIARGRVHRIPYQIDTDFWQAQVSPDDEPMIASCGLEQRDYATLIGAVSDLPVSVRIAAASHWSSSQNRLAGVALPANVSAGSYDYSALRDLYSRARFVVVPLLPTDFQAGITTVLEAASCARAVIATRTPGQQTAIVGPDWSAGQATWPVDGPTIDHATGIYATPGDTDAMRSAIKHLLENPALASRLGENSRRLLESQPGVQGYAAALARVIDPAFAGAGEGIVAQTGSWVGL